MVSPDAECKKGSGRTTVVDSQLGPVQDVYHCQSSMAKYSKLTIIFIYRLSVCLPDSRSLNEMQMVCLAFFIHPLFLSLFTILIRLLRGNILLSANNSWLHIK